MEIKDNSFLRQFETQQNQNRIAVEYAQQERKLFLTRITTSEGFQDEEFLDQMLTQILDNALEKNLKVVPTYPRIAAFFRKNPKYRELLPPGIKL